MSDLLRMRAVFRDTLVAWVKALVPARHSPALLRLRGRVAMWAHFALPTLQFPESGPTSKIQKRGAR
jgi:hypothetical protein